jgi:uncharacterized protein CbrC (UPF0167 family)
MRDVAPIWQHRAMPHALPAFRYHPDPIATGSVEAEPFECACCGEHREYRYVGPIYSIHPVRKLCPWCIADGSAAAQFDVEFTGVLYPAESVPGTVLDEVLRRTPGFIEWQAESWMFHCGDAAAYLGRAGRAELADHDGAIATIVADLEEQGLSHEQIEAHVAALHVDGDVTAQLFRCLHCSTHVAYVDVS